MSCQISEPGSDQPVATSSANSKEPATPAYEFQPTRFRTLPFITVIFLIILFISQAIQWYSQTVTLPRFCEDPELAIHHLQEIITQRSPAGNESRRPYIIAAKLIYLLPQKGEESDQDYIYRVRRELNQRCMQ